jgi:hypothetical protein
LEPRCDLGAQAIDQLLEAVQVCELLREQKKR